MLHSCGLEATRRVLWLPDVYSLQTWLWKKMSFLERRVLPGPGWELFRPCSSAKGNLNVGL